MSDSSAQTPMVGDAPEESDSCVKKYFAKFAGAGAARPPRAALAYTGQSFLGAFVGMSVLGLLTTYLLKPGLHMSVEVPPYGAMSVILFSAFKVPVAQPYNAIVGNTLGGCVGVLVILAMKALSIESMLWLGGALSVSLTILIQELTGSVHPPGGATALLYAYTPALQSLTFGYILITSLLGTVILVALATVMNNLNAERQYPQTWLNPFMSPSQPKFEQMKPTEMKDMKGDDPEDHAASEGDSASEGESCSMLRSYFAKFGGAGAAVEERKPLSYTVYSVLGSFAGMAAIGLLHTYVLMPLKPQEVASLGAPMVLEVAAFGAMSVLLFSTWKAPLAQPFNTVVGNTIGGAVGVLVVEVMRLLGIEHMLWLGGALAVALTIVVQEATGTVHPPGGATALLYVINAALHKMHFLFALCPACLGAIVMVSVAVLTNNIAPDRVYPQRWE